jgi:hypothetical protein
MFLFMIRFVNKIEKMNEESTSGFSLDGGTGGTVICTNFVISNEILMVEHHAFIYGGAEVTGDCLYGNFMRHHFFFKHMEGITEKEFADCLQFV